VASLLPELAVTPGRGQVVLTEPVPDLKIRGIFHFDRGYYYFREIEGRVLFGGGRQLDAKTETTTEEGPNSLILNDLADKLKHIILPGVSFKIAQQWSGIMAFGPEKSPLVLRVTPHIYAGVRMGGMGIAIGSAVGEQLAALMSEQQ
jgi:glycine/D-amino acid oxidase-like deaminating enzyme